MRATALLIGTALTMTFGAPAQAASLTYSDLDLALALAQSDWYQERYLDASYQAPVVTAPIFEGNNSASESTPVVVPRATIRRVSMPVGLSASAAMPERQVSRLQGVWSIGAFR